MRAVNKHPLLKRMPDGSFQPVEIKKIPPFREQAPGEPVQDYVAALVAYQRNYFDQ